MRFTNLEGFTDLPIDAIEHRFRNELVLAVLPVSAGVAGRDALLVATSRELALVIAVPGNRDYWTTYLAPWEMVWLGPIESEAGSHRLPVQVDSLELSIRLWGPTGEQALRDFVNAAESQRVTVTVAT
ncbi:MAG: hypothetical protein PVG27_12540 [Chloroflexota bacterium]|jgi:hypothetical protein